MARQWAAFSHLEAFHHWVVLLHWAAFDLGELASLVEVVARFPFVAVEERPFFEGDPQNFDSYLGVVLEDFQDPEPAVEDHALAVH